MKTGKGVESHKVLRQVFKKKSNKRVAQELRLSRSLVDKWSRPGRNGCGEELNPLDRVERIILVTEDLASLHWLCAQFDGFFVKNPPAKAAAPELKTAVCQVAVALSALFQLVGLLLTQKCIGGAEVVHLRQCWEKTKSLVEGFVQACERGVFRCGVLWLSLGWSLFTGDAPVLVEQGV